MLITLKQGDRCVAEWLEETMPSRTRHLHPNVWICEYVTLQGKWDFAGVIKVKDFEVGVSPGLSH